MNEKEPNRKNWQFMSNEYTDSFSEFLKVPHYEGLDPEEEIEITKGPVMGITTKIFIVVLVVLIIALIGFTFF